MCQAVRSKSHPFDDCQHGQRLRETVRRLAEHPGKSVSQASSSASESQSIYRFWAIKRVKLKQTLASYRTSVVERANRQRVVLSIQDTTDLDFSSLQQPSGLDFINQSSQQGIKVHSHG
jgi:site-specific DNA-adenine methylase